MPVGMAIEMRQRADVLILKVKSSSKKFFYLFDWKSHALRGQL